jgi:hypothetical protein
VRAWIEELIEAAGDPRRVARARLFTSQPAVVRRFAERLHAGVELLIEPLVDAIRQGHQQGLFSRANPRLDARLILGLASRAMVDALAERPDQSIDQSVAEVTDFALRALGYDSGA